MRRATYPTLDYEVDGRVARLTFNRPERGNTITADTPLDLAHAVEGADLDPAVHVLVLSGRGKGFCGGYDLGIYAENADRTTGGLIALLAVAAASLVGALLGGLAGMRFHRKVDQAAAEPHAD